MKGFTTLYSCANPISGNIPPHNLLAKILSSIQILGFKLHRDIKQGKLVSEATTFALVCPSMPNHA